MNGLKTDVIIPVFRPDGKFIRLLEMLGRQTCPVSHVYVVNTGKEIYDAFASSHKIPDLGGRLSVTHIEPADFDHGGTRAEAVKASDADVFVMMTQDAVPYDEYLIEKLLEALDGDASTAAAYARQLPGADASETEKYVRSFNYPAASSLKGKEDLERLGIKTFFCSDVCAAYKRSVYDSLGGFIHKTIFNEDMIFASGAVKAGYRIAYAADAKVIHSHNYTGAQQLHRNFDLAVSQTDHPEVFSGYKSEGEGMKLVRGCIRHLADTRRLYLAPGFIWNCACRYAGFRLGRSYRKLPSWLVMKLTSNRTYWGSRT